MDGFPRKASQAKLLDEVLGRHGDADGLNLVVALKVPDEVILERIEGASCPLFWSPPGADTRFRRRTMGALEVGTDLQRGLLLLPRR